MLTELPPGVRAWIDSAPRCPDAITARVVAALRQGQSEFLARLYESIVGAPNRRELGTFFTPQDTVEWMLDRWSSMEPAPTTVVDVGAGVGVFTAHALAQWQPQQIYAVDVNPVTLGLLGALAVVMSPSHASLRMVLDDYTAWQMPRRAGSCVTIGNPPYTRLQLLPRRQRARLLSEVGDCGSRAGLATWILACALARLRDDDGVLFLLPRNWMEADYGSPLRAKLWAATNRRVELTNLSGDLFGDARVDAVALLIGPTKVSPQPFVLRPSPDALGREHLDRSGTPVPFAPDAVRPTHARGGNRRNSGDVTVPLCTVAKVRRGAATGDNAFFALSEQRRKELCLPPSSVRPLVRRLRNHENDTIEQRDLDRLETTRWLLVATAASVKQSKSLQSYIGLGNQTGVAERHLCQQRKPWFALGSEVTYPDVIVGAMTSGCFRFIENRAGAAITNNLFGLTWLPHVTAKQREAILAWLRSDEGQRAILAQCRTQAGGLRKIEPRMLASLSVPQSLTQ